jgi:hypothetical protein
MGRKQLNRTKDEIREQNRIRAKRFYDKHKDSERVRKLEDYYRSKVEKENEGKIVEDEK